MVITVDKEAVRRSGMMLKDSIPDVMTISLKGRSSVYKNELMFYEMISQSNWKRPIYVAITVGADNYGSLGDNFIKEGLAYRISPFNTEKTKNTIDVDKMYDNLMNRYRYGGLDKKGLYIDENAMRMCWSHRVAFSQTVLQLLLQGDTVRHLPDVRRGQDEENRKRNNAVLRAVAVAHGRLFPPPGQRKRRTAVTPAAVNAQPDTE